MSRCLSLAFLLILCSVLFFYRLPERSLSSSHEARAAQNAHMILSDGNWALPRMFNQRLELQKPPLYYWMIAALSWLRGVDVDAAAVRLPAALSALGCVLVVYLLLATAGRPIAALLAGMILASCVHFTWLARVGRIDMPLTLAVTIALVCIHKQRSFPEGVQQDSPGQRPGNEQHETVSSPERAQQRSSAQSSRVLLEHNGIDCGAAHVSHDALLRPFRAFSTCAMSATQGVALGYFVAPLRGVRAVIPNMLDVHLLFIAYSAIAVGILLKGPIAIVLVLLVVTAQLISKRKPGSHLRPLFASLPWGVPLVVVLAVPWFVYANWRTDGKLWHEFFVHHNLQRGLGGADDLDGEPLWYYFPRLLIDLLPWSLAAPLAIWQLRRRSIVPDADARFGLVWFLAIVGFLSLMHFKRADYLLPAYPGFAIWLGCLLEPRESRAAAKRRIALIAGLAGCCALGWMVFLAQTDSVAPHTYRRFAEEIRRRTERPVIFFRTEAHEVVFHVGRPLDTILEWENLDFWATRPKTTYMVMPPDCAATWPQHLHRGKLEEVLRSTDIGHAPRPLVLMRSVAD